MTQDTKTQDQGLDRRDFFARTAAGGAGFLLGFAFDASTRAMEASGTEAIVNSYIKVGIDDSITILFGGCELGQGTMTGLAQIIAEDLMVDLNNVKVETALASSISYTTAGSGGMRNRYTRLRTAGAAARDMFVAAGAAAMAVPVAECIANNGKVIHQPTSNSVTYGSVATQAAALPVPLTPALVPVANFRYIGKPVPRIDIPSKVNGKAQFGIDVRLPNMAYAVIRQCPTLGGTLTSTPAKPASAIAVVPCTAQDNRGAQVAGTINAVAVVADNTWKAWQLSKSLSVKWTIPATSAAMDTAAINTQATSLMATGTPIVPENVGDVNGAFLGASKIVEATYSFPYLAHATLEPMNCTASVTPTSCEVWAPTQAANSVLATARAVTGLATNQIIVHTTYLGGGLGRKIEQDYISQAIQISKATGRPIKLWWPREEDFTHDVYRPTALVRVKAGIDLAGNIVSWYSRNVSPSILRQRGAALTTNDSQATDGLLALKYAMSSRKAEWVPNPAAVPVGFWRSVGHSINTYAVECMIDELAFAANLDPILYRQLLFASNPRAKALMDKADEVSQWRKTLPATRKWGTAFCESFGTMVAMVVECSAPTATSVKVHRVEIIVDCGFAVNPNSIEAQMQGGMVHGLAAALWGQIPFKLGAAQVKNFNNYRMLKLGDMPRVTVTIVNSGTPTGGAGEPATPPIGPAVANAWFRLTGTRIRSLPMFPTQSAMGGG